MHRGGNRWLVKKQPTRRSGGSSNQWGSKDFVVSSDKLPTSSSSRRRSSSFYEFMAPRRKASWWADFSHAAMRWKSPVALHDQTHDGPSSSSSIADDRGLSRRLGVFDLILLGIGGSIGAGIFVVTGTIANDTGPGVTISFALAGLACVANALCYAELASRFPALVGGAYLYAYSAFNELVAFLVFCQLMLDYHIGAASIARSLAGYLVNLLELIPALTGRIPVWFGPGGKTLLGGFFSINVLAPIILLILTAILCQGVRESVAVNGVMTVTKVLIVLVVIILGAFEVDTSNWTPFAPNGIPAIVTGATVAYFAYVGFDAVANSAEESRQPKRDLPIGILVSLITCAALYVGVCLVVTGMVPYQDLAGDAPLAQAFSERGLPFITALISVGAVAGLTTTLLVGLYVQSRLYLGLGRDGLLPSLFAKIHFSHHTPIMSQIWCGSVAGVLAAFFDVSHLSHILSVGTLSGYSVVCGCVLILRVSQDDLPEKKSERILTRSQEAVCCLLGVALCGFLVGLFFRFSFHYVFMIVGLVIGMFVAVPMYYRQVYKHPTGFLCPGVPTIPLLGVILNMFLFAQLHWEGWVRFVVLGALSVGFYAFYGQYHAKHEEDHRHSYVAIDSQHSDPDEA